VSDECIRSLFAFVGYYDGILIVAFSQCSWLSLRASDLFLQCIPFFKFQLLTFSHINPPHSKTTPTDKPTNQPSKETTPKQTRIHCTHRRSTRLLQKDGTTLGLNTLTKQPRIIRRPTTNQRTPRLLRFRKVTDRGTKDCSEFGGCFFGPGVEFGTSGGGGAGS
jgi:hypothetical protein